MDWMPVSLTKPIFLLFWLSIPVIWIMITRSSLRNEGRLSRILIGGLRSLLIVILGLALSDPRIMRYSDRVNLFFCLDVSKSVRDEGEKVAMDFMKRTTIDMNEEDRAGLIIFGREPSLEIDLKGDFDPNTLKSQVNTNFTNIYEALQMAIGKLPQKGKNRIVLFSDGNQNLEDSIEMAFLASSLGIEIYPVPITSWFKKNEVFMEKLETPPTVLLETPFDIRLLVMSTRESEAGLVLLRNGKLLANQGVKLGSGKNVFRFSDTLKEQGLYLYKAVINAAEDNVSENNEGLSFTHGTRKSEILYLSGEKRQAHHLARALRAQGLNIVLKGIEDLPRSIHGLINYNAIIFDNVSAHSLSFTAMESLEMYVKDIGGGLVMIGGDKSFGVGHYKRTPVEKALPVFMDVPTTLEFPSFCLILVMDKSSSMAGSINGKSKLEGAKIAAFSTVEMLNPTDRVGILAFDTEFQWIVPITQAKERRKIANRLSTLKESGGTHLYSGLKEAFRVLKEVRAAKKHVIVLSDGLTKKADFRSLLRSMREVRTTVSTVAVGDDSDVKLMKAIAEWGGGRSYYTNDAENIPRIFVSETKTAAKRIIVEKAMQPYAAMQGEMILGIPFDELPLVNGLIITYPKPGARVLLKTQEGPLLVAWPYGLGRSVAFTSDLSGRWGKDWVLWDHYGKFVSQMVKWAQRKESPRNYAVNIGRRGEEGTFTVDVTDDQNRFVNNLDLKIKVLFPSETDRTISLEQVAPGRYHVSFPSGQIGEYYLNLFSTDAKGFSQSQIFGYGIPYADEYNSRGVNYALLKGMALITNGRLLKPQEDSVNLFTTNSETKEYGGRLWPYLVLASLLLLMADVIVRKLQSLGRIT